MRTKMRSVAILGASLFLAASLRAQEAPGQLGLGLYIGTPFGFSAKYLIDRRNAVDFAIGAQGDNLDLHADLLTHFRGFSPQPSLGRLAPYLGLGFKIADQSDVLFGIRYVGGVACLMRNTPVEVFAEIVPVLRLTPSLGSNLDGGVGLRYYFGAGGKAAHGR
jgi:hypothetical protein